MLHFGIYVSICILILECETFIIAWDNGRSLQLLFSQEKPISQPHRATYYLSRMLSNPREFNKHLASHFDALQFDSGDVLWILLQESKRTFLSFPVFLSSFGHHAKKSLCLWAFLLKERKTKCSPQPWMSVMENAPAIPFLAGLSFFFLYIFMYIFCHQLGSSVLCCWFYRFICMHDFNKPWKYHLFISCLLSITELKARQGVLREGDGDVVMLGPLPTFVSFWRMLGIGNYRLLWHWCSAIPGLSTTRPLSSRVIWLSRQ